MIDHPHDDETEDDGTPLDPDITLVTDYLAKALSPQDAAAFEQRLRDDPEFFLKVGPIMKIWNMPVRFGKDAKEAGDKIRAAIAHMDDPEPSDRASLWSELRGWAETGVLVTLMLVTLGVAYFLLTKNRPEAQPSSPPTVTAVFARTPGTKMLHAPPGDSLVATLEDSTRIVLRNGASFAYRWPFGRSHGVSASLDGEATIQVSEAEKIMALQTSAGSLAMAAGSYAVRCNPGSLEALITVQQGSATLPRSPKNPIVILSTGQFGHIVMGGVSEQTAGGSEYPQSVMSTPTPGAH